MSIERAIRQTPYHARVTRDGVTFYVRTVQGCARQMVVPIPVEVRRETGLWKGRRVHLWVQGQTVCIRAMKDDLPAPEHVL